MRCSNHTLGVVAWFYLTYITAHVLGGSKVHIMRRDLVQCQSLGGGGVIVTKP